MRFSIVMVALNPGEKLDKTLQSVFRQTCTDYEIVLKDGGSTDGSVDIWKNRADGRAAKLYGEAAAGRVAFFQEPDKGIYDAMNQAVTHVKGDFVLFLNCGDLLADERVLERVAAEADRALEAAGRTTDADKASETDGLVLYGDTLGEKNGVVIASAPKITGFTCYRNIPCHQSCFYSARLCREKPYNSEYRIRADYEHFLWCFYRAKAQMIHLNFPVSSYEGGGYSENRENRKRDKEEHRQITQTYMPKAKLLGYRLLMLLTLAPLRSFLAENKAFSGIYHWVKKRLYKGGQA